MNEFIDIISMFSSGREDRMMSVTPSWSGRLPRNYYANLLGPNIRSEDDHPNITWDDVLDDIKISTVEDLSLDYKKISASNFKKVPKFKKIKYLSLRGNRFKSLNGISTLGRTLVFLNLTECKLSSFSGTKELINLEILIVASNDIGSFKSLPELPKLLQLDVSLNSFGSFKGFPMLLKLTTLNVNCCGIKNFSALPLLPELKLLNCQSNAFKSFNGLKKLPKLETIKVDYNRPFETFSGLPKCLNLKSIDVSSNPKLKSFDGIPNLPKLEHVDLPRNNLTNDELIVYLNQKNIVCPLTNPAEPVEESDELCLFD